MSGKRPPEETLRALERLVAEEEDDEVETKSDAELDAELAGLGFDPKAERAFAEDLARQLVESKSAASPSPAEPDHHDHDHDHDGSSGGGRWFNFGLAASIAALFGAGVLSASGVLSPDVMTEVVGHPNDGADVAEAHQLREEAGALAKEGRWKESLEKLEKAQKLDPRGAEDEAVERLRRLDEEKLGGPEEAPREGK